MLNIVVEILIESFHLRINGVPCKMFVVLYSIITTITI